MTAVAVSPGRITAMWLVLRCLGRVGGMARASEVDTIAKRSALRSGGLPVGDGITLALAAGLTAGSVKGDLALTAAGYACLKLGVDDEPTHDARRFLTARLLLNAPPGWVAVWQGNPDDAAFVIPRSEREVLSDVGLELQMGESGKDLEAVAFWRALERVPLTHVQPEFLKAIGNAAEELSLEHERARLESEGFPDLAARVRWVSQESDAYGFDILSFAGASSVTPDGPVAIEVKGTALRGPEATVFVSEHEWAVAEEFPEQYVLHLWCRVAAPRGEAPTGEGPELFAPSAIRAHVAGKASCDDGCGWHTSRIQLVRATHSG